VLRVPHSSPGLAEATTERSFDGERQPTRDGDDLFYRRPDAQADPAFCSWLGRTLHDVYDPIAREPLPFELADLIRQLESLPQSRPH
jgi:hypothetical protein